MSWIVKVDQVLWKGECDYLDITGFVNVLDSILPSSPSSSTIPIQSTTTSTSTTTMEVADQSENVVKSVIEEAGAWSIRTLLVCSQKAFPIMIQVRLMSPVNNQPFIHSSISHSSISQSISRSVTSRMTPLP